MSSRRLGDWLSSFLRYMENSEPPELFKLWSGVATVAAVLQRKCWVNWEKKIYPNMYIVLVGPSGCRKGTAMGPCLDLLLQQPSVRLAAEAITREALIKKLKTCNEVTVVDGGPAQRHASITIWSQELAVFLGYNNPAFLSNLTDWYDCRDIWSYETIGRGTEEIYGVWVNMVGATTPSTLQSSLPQDAIGGGLSSRIIFVYGDKKSKIVDVPIRTAEEIKLLDDLSYDLTNVSQLSGEFRMTKDYLEKRIAWRRREESHPPLMDYRFEGYITRRATHMLKLSMVLSASRDEEMILDGEIHDKAKAIMETTEGQMSKVFRGYGMRDNATLFPQVMADIAGAKSINFNSLYSRFINDFSPQEFRAVLESFQRIGYCKLEMAKGDTMIVYQEK